ncbi:23S rRNA (adenine(1618)-N(6))-methyltransferase RlmF [Zobellia uliginosa]|uniref:23S rRNA (adenine(1618)-N(6))-methyltransferase RlmF n=1 Tax=Zobellia uliginosa TaxID=143224 RepID=UPI001C0706A5|nr:23S rRNA (adenine(1618)-N(6))-methyltransferase RlmF [Zobellia uliginosa]MBU2946242.1 23S rRNA (adenine(1618)-N(6))-methyltransferase RlmF [Zobellia uliginosa]
MSSEKQPKDKARLHARNKNRERYDLEALKVTNPELKGFIKLNKFGAESIDFSNPKAVRLLNKALLNHYYGIKCWDFPEENLCPPIPGRADYIHHIAELLGSTNSGNIPTGNKVSCFDVGVGASCIYPIIGVTEYGWHFYGSDIDPKSIASAQEIVLSNPSLRGKVECRLQKSSRDIFKGVLSPEQKIDIVISNPPFHASIEEAQKGTRRKIKNLSGKKVKTPELNFSGISNELIYDGGESRFIENMIWESRKFAKNCYVFSTLVSKESNLKRIYKLLEKVEATQIKTIPMGTGNKSSRIVAWSFFSKEEQIEWVESRW